MTYIIPPVTLSAVVRGDESQVIPTVCEIKVFRHTIGETTQLFEGHLTDGVLVQALRYDHQPVTDYAILEWRLGAGAKIPLHMRKADQ